MVVGQADDWAVGGDVRRMTIDTATFDRTGLTDIEGEASARMEVVLQKLGDVLECWRLTPTRFPSSRGTI
ncbi:MAG: hypothetical protein DMF89_27195 [Acidobacteria bacterium]|nr:MAG: hypothetical protein DMF89_27195 [Acidobacteriota bacterium]